MYKSIIFVYNIKNFLFILDIMTAILQLVQVAVMRHDFVLCDKVDLSLYAGDICHIIGENGLGKTTLLHQIVGILPTQKGVITKNCPPPLVVMHQTGVHDNLSVKDNLAFLANLYGQNPSDEMITHALQCVGLSAYDDVKAGKLSAGQGRRVGLARLFLPFASDINMVRLWVLDEPFTALDTVMIDKLETLIQQFANKGGAVIMTSHQAVNVKATTLDLTQFLQ